MSSDFNAAGVGLPTNALKSVVKKSSKKNDRFGMYQGHEPEEIAMKNRQTYKILTILGAFFLFVSLPVNRMYLGEKWAMRFFTFNYLFFGIYADLFYMDKRFDETMAGRGFTNTQIRNAAGE
jgi:hypothetical protein